MYRENMKLSLKEELLEKAQASHNNGISYIPTMISEFYEDQLPYIHKTAEQGKLEYPIYLIEMDRFKFSNGLQLSNYVNMEFLKEQLYLGIRSKLQADGLQVNYNPKKSMMVIKWGEEPKAKKQKIHEYILEFLGPSPLTKIALVLIMLSPIALMLLSR